MKRVSKDTIRDLILIGGSKSVFTFKANRRKRMPERRVEVSPSPWDKPKMRNFTVCGFIGNKLIWCENGLSLDAAVTTVCASKNGD